MELKNFKNLKQLNSAEEAKIEAMYNCVVIDDQLEEAKYSNVEIDGANEYETGIIA